MFGEDAQIAAKELEIALTSREAGNAGRIPMCGVPYHAVNSYLDKLVSKGYRVAICEQLEDPKQAKGVVKRDVVRVVTPGTFIEGSLEDKRSQYLTAVAQVGESFGAASLDVSTGQFLVTELASFAQLEDELLRLSPAELVAGSSSPILERLRAAAAHLQITISEVEQRLNPVDDAAEALRRHFQVATLEPFGLNTPAKTLAAGMALAYAQQTQKGILEHILKVQTYTLEQFLQIDAHSRQNLELTRTIRDGRRRLSLLGVIDQTRTSMGGRMLRWNLEQPLVSPEEITQRQDAVACLVENASLRLEVQELLDQVYDLERLMGRLTVGTGNARDLRALCSSLQVVPRVKELPCWTDSGAPQENRGAAGPSLPDLAALIDRAIVDNPPISVRDGGLVKTGFSPNSMTVRAASRDGKTWIKNLEAQERKRTGIKSLKVGFNKVFGYYIEVTNPNLDLVPEDYQRKQTLSNAERFITPELKEKESLILGADERSVEMEYALFCQVRDQAKEHMGQIQANAAALAFLDMLQSLAEAAVRHNYVRSRDYNRYNPWRLFKAGIPSWKHCRTALCPTIWL